MNAAQLEAKIGRLEQQLGSLLAHPLFASVLNDPAAQVPTIYIEDLAVTTAKIASLNADKIVAGDGIINNLTIKAMLTLGAGGSIVDADGSTWDQDGITLKAAGSQSDVIRIARDAFVGDLQIQASIGTLAGKEATQAWFRTASLPDDATKSYDAFLNLASIGNFDDASPSALVTLGLRIPDGTVTFEFAGIEINSPTPGAGVSDGAHINLGTQGLAANIGLNGSVALHANGGVGSVYLREAATVPTGNPTAGIYIYLEGGSLKARTTAGNIRTIAAV